MKELSPSDRVQLRGQGELMAPGTCALCGSGNCEDGYADTGIFYDYEGQVYFCASCVVEIGNVMGMLDSKESEFLLTLNKQIATELETVKAERDELRVRIDQYDALLSGAFSGVISVESVTEQSTDGEESGSTDDSNDGTPVLSDSGEPVVTKSDPEPVVSGTTRKASSDNRAESGISI